MDEQEFQAKRQEAIDLLNRAQALHWQAVSLPRDHGTSVQATQLESEAGELDLRAHALLREIGIEPPETH